MFASPAHTQTSQHQSHTFAAPAEENPGCELMLRQMRRLLLEPQSISGCSLQNWSGAAVHEGNKA